MLLKSIISLLSITIGSVSGFGLGYVGKEISKGAITIEESIKNNLGYKLISESPNRYRLYSVISKHNKQEIIDSKLLNKKITDTSKDTEDAFVLEKWCSQALELPLNVTNEYIASHASKWCVIAQNLQHRLIDEGHATLEDFFNDEEKKLAYEKIYDSEKEQEEYKQVVFKDFTNSSSISSNEAVEKNSEWCKKSAFVYSDSSENSVGYLRFKKWCTKDIGTSISDVFVTNLDLSSISM